MIRLIGLMTGSTIVTSLMFASAAFAEDEPASPIPEAKQARLLERFGDEGIDADGDGVLTREEVHTFFADSDLPGMHRRHGPHKMRGCGDCDGCGPRGKHGPRGKRGHHRGPGGRLGMMLRHLEQLGSETPPPQFDPAKFSEADSDGDGVLSDTEWTAFAKQQRQRLLGRLAERVPRADADNDGVISDTELAELTAWVAGRVLRRHPEADTNGDGTLSDDEWDALHAGRMERRRARILENHPEADLDGDGVLSDEEIESFHDSRPGRPHGKHRGGGPGFGHGRGCSGGSK